ncbi:MAG: serine/threonine protein kinase, partial [Nannocystaceae bacterium]
ARPADAAAEMHAGSIGYVAPEQARAEAVDPRADVFSAGCLLYELLTLDRAFPHEGVWVAPDLGRIPDSVREPLRRALSLQ